MSFVIAELPPPPSPPALEIVTAMEGKAKKGDGDRGHNINNNDGASINFLLLVADDDWLGQTGGLSDLQIILLMLSPSKSDAPVLPVLPVLGV